MSDRCDLTDLVVEQCAHCQGHNENPKAQATGPTIEARMSGTCACCRVPFGVGASITYSGEAGGWCLTEHTEA